MPRCLGAITVNSLPYYDAEFAPVIESRGQECYVVQPEETKGIWYRLANFGTGKCIKASRTGSKLDTILAR